VNKVEGRYSVVILTGKPELDYEEITDELSEEDYMKIEDIVNKTIKEKKLDTKYPNL